MYQTQRRWTWRTGLDWVHQLQTASDVGAYLQGMPTQTHTAQGTALQQGHRM